MPELEAKGAKTNLIGEHQDMASTGSPAYIGGLGQSPQQGPGAEPLVRSLEVYLKMYFVARLKLALKRNLLKCNSNLTKKITKKIED